MSVDHIFTKAEDAFIYYTECQLATVEFLEGLSRPSKSQVRRQKGIAEGMVRQCQILGYDPSHSDLHTVKTCTRVRDALAELKKKEPTDEPSKIQD